MLIIRLAQVRLEEGTSQSSVKASECTIDQEAKVTVNKKNGEGRNVSITNIINIKKKERSFRKRVGNIRSENPIEENLDWVFCQIFFDFKVSS
jgi:hypothetical protein